jgi:hypothetical protein
VARAKAKTKALADFLASLAAAEQLIKIEKDLPNPPRKSEQPRTSGLRGGAAVLMVASFEAFLKDVVVEHLTELTVHPPPIPFASLPEKMRVSSVYYCLEGAMRGDPHKARGSKLDRLSDIKVACTLVASEKIDPLALCSTKSNPSSDTVKDLFRDLGVSDVFGKIHNRFVGKRRWGKPEPLTFIADKLNEIVQRRHRVAHTGQALDISRLQLNESIKFLRILAELLDRELRAHIDSLYPAPPP